MKPTLDNSPIRLWKKPLLKETLPQHWAHLVACELVGLPASMAIPAVLEKLGVVGQADRVYIIEYNEELTLFRNTHEWTRRGVTSHVEDLQNTPVDMLEFLHRDALSGKAVAIEDVFDMPSGAKELQAEFIRQGNKSVLCLPMFLDGRLCGLFGFDTTRQKAQWSEEVVFAMFACAELLARILHRPEPYRRLQLPTDFPGLAYLRDGSTLHGVPIANIIAVRAMRNNSEVTLDDLKIYNDSRSLKEWEAVLPAEQFMRVHRSAFLRATAICKLERRVSGRWHVKLFHCDEAWNISRDVVAELRIRLNGASALEHAVDQD